MVQSFCVGDCLKGILSSTYWILTRMHIVVMRRWRISFTAFHKVAHGLLEKEVSQGSLIQFYRSVLNSFLSENRKILLFFWWIWSELAHFCCRVFQWKLGLLGERSGVKSIFFGLQHAKIPATNATGWSRCWQNWLPYAAPLPRRVRTTEAGIE